MKLALTVNPERAAAPDDPVIFVRITYDEGLRDLAALECVVAVAVRDSALLSRPTVAMIDAGSVGHAIPADRARVTLRIFYEAGPLARADLARVIDQAVVASGLVGHAIVEMMAQRGFPRPPAVGASTGSLDMQDVRSPRMGGDEP